MRLTTLHSFIRLSVCVSVLIAKSYLLSIAKCSPRRGLPPHLFGELWRPWLGDVAADGRRLQLPEGRPSHMSAPGDLHTDLHRRTSAQAVVEATITRRKTAQAAALAADERVLKALSDAFEAAQQPLSAEEQLGLTSVAATIIGGSYVTIGGLALGGGIVMGMRSFEETAAFEVLEKMEKPTAAAEAQAMKLASRSFGLATLLTVGSAALTL